jgi:23S rRNA (cytidine1920-2'-O)/16S rRNA (cytidine1409-2'-O)-methyltransferase
VALVRRGLLPSRPKAVAAVLAGRVLVDGVPVDKPGRRVPPEAVLTVREPAVPYVSRGGLKLAAALDRFRLDPEGWVCLDVGASTGGFTDCLLRRGARRVYAVDVGYGQLAWSLRQDPRVVVRERVNARYLSREHVPEEVDLAAVDVSFISLAKVLPAVGERVRPEGAMVCLVKPSFEAGPRDVPRGGVVRDPRVHARVLAAVAEAAGALGWSLHGLMPSPVLGAEGNREFLALLRRAPAAEPAATWIARALAEAGDPGG